MRFLVITTALVLYISELTVPERSITPDHPQERLRIVIEEVQLPVVAYDNYGNPDPSVEIDDLLVLENGTAQEVRSVLQVPADIILLLDTGGEINAAKSVRITSEIAVNFVSALSRRHRLSVLQYSDKVELLQDWTNDHERVTEIVEKKLFSGKRSLFSDALLAAVDQFRETPIGSRHVVLITDGVGTSRGANRRAEALKELAASNAVVHVISYKNVSAEALRKSRRVLRDRDKSLVHDEAITALPGDYKPLKRAHEPGGTIADVDPERFIRVLKYERAMRKSDWQLAVLARQSGGRLWLPESFGEMIADGAAVARLIDSSYVIGYKPKLSPASLRADQIQRIEVLSRRVGLNIVSPTRYTLKATNVKKK